MKVLQINAVYGYKSTGIIVRDIETALKAEGHDSIVAYQTAKTETCNGYRVGNMLSWKIHALLSRVFGKQAYFSSGDTRKLLKFISREKPDVVHLHNLHSNFIHLCKLLKYLAKNDIATVITLHDCWFFTGKCYHYIDVGCDKFTTECQKCPKKKDTPTTFFFDTSKRVFNEKKKCFGAIPRLTVVGCSDWICNEAKKSFLKTVPIKRIYNGVDTDVFYPRNKSYRSELGLKDEDFVVLGMANKWLLPENRELLDSFLNTDRDNCKLVIVGCKDNERQALLQKKSEKIVPIGYIEGREQLSKIYSMADVFVNPTYADTLPTVNMESICCGTPVITYDAGGSAELVANGTGRVVKAGDVGAVLNILNKEKLEILPEDLEAARQKFDKNTSYREYVDLYKTLVGQ